jgi:hypothetical protein
MHFRFLIRSILLFFPLFMKAQTAVIILEDKAEIARKVHRSLYFGNKWALRDLATFLDDPEVGELARNGLRNMTQFSSKEIDWNKPVKKQQFLDFFYKNHEKISFDPIIGSWLLTPIDKSELKEFVVKPIAETANADKLVKSSISLLKQSITKGDTSLFVKSSAQISSLRNDEAWEELLKLIKNDDFWKNNTFPKSFRPQLVWSNTLKNCPFPEAFTYVIDWLKKDKITESEAEIPLSELSNQFIHIVEKKSMLQKLVPLFDSLGSLEAMKNDGFYRVFPSDPIFFDEKIDFYAYYLSKSDGQPWARNNAIEALIRSHHPRSLYYLASRVFRSRYQAEQYPDFSRYIQPLLDPIEELTKQKIAVQDAKGATVYNSIDAQWMLNYTRYWAAHWQDYEWDEKRGHFINVLKSETILEAYDHLFRKLTATNDSIAMLAYRKLTEGNPVEILPLADQYRQTIRSINPNLPSYKYKTLEQLTLLTDFCRDNRYDWHIEYPFRSLSSSMTPQVRYLLENQLVEHSDISMITGLEYEALMNENNLDYSFSLSRIIDLIYAKNWDKILENEQELRFFLKKARLFFETGSVGSCSNYLQKLDYEQKEIQQILKNIEDNETDEQILQSIYSLKARNVKINADTKLDENQLLTPETISNRAATLKKDIEQLLKSDTVSLQLMNRILTSTAYKPEEHKKLVLSNIAKLHPLSTIKKLNPIVKFSLKEDFEYFRNLPLKTVDFGSILRFFKGDETENIIQFLVEKSSNMTEDERGSFFNEILRNDVIRQSIIRSRKDDASLQTIAKVLTAWYENQDNFSTFEAENVLVHLFLLDNKGASLVQNLAASHALDVESNVKYKIERQLLSAVKFEDLKDIVLLLPNLSDNDDGLPGYTFLNTDFGFPPNAYHQMSELKPLQKNFNELSEAEFYKTSLRQFGVLFENKSDQSLDFQAIATMLEFDLVTPFSGGGGERRDWYVFALVKILENHFNTNLGFHAKLNENQTFYTYNSSKRAQLWLNYLEDKNLTKSLKKGKSWNFR